MTKYNINFPIGNFLFFLMGLSGKIQNIFWFFKSDLENVTNKLFWEFLVLTKFYFSDLKFLNFWRTYQEKTQKIFSFFKTDLENVKIISFWVILVLNIFSIWNLLKPKINAFDAFIHSGKKLEKVPFF